MKAGRCSLLAFSVTSSTLLHSCCSSWLRTAGTWWARRPERPICTPSCARGTTSGGRRGKTQSIIKILTRCWRERRLSSARERDNKRSCCRSRSEHWNCRRSARNKSVEKQQRGCRSTARGRRGRGGSASGLSETITFLSREVHRPPPTVLRRNPNAAAEAAADRQTNILTTIHTNILSVCLKPEKGQPILRNFIRGCDNRLCRRSRGLKIVSSIL